MPDLRGYGYYSHRRIGMRAKQGAGQQIKIDRALVRGAAPRWAALVQRVYEVDPLLCPRCGGVMRVISFIEARQRDVIEKILRHCGLWEGPLRTLAAARGPPGGRPAAGERPEPRLVLDPEFGGPIEPPELQLVLDPDFF